MENAGLYGVSLLTPDYTLNSEQKQQSGLPRES